MEILTPSQVAVNRGLRMSAPVYSTSTPAPQPREHIMAVEIDTLFGRHWSHMPESGVDSFITLMTAGEDDDLSDIDHSAMCWCQK